MTYNHTHLFSYCSGGQAPDKDLTGLKKSRCWPGWYLMEALSGKKPFPCLYQLLEASYTPWLMAFSSIVKCITPISASVLAHLLLWFWLLLPPSFKDHCDDSGSTWIIQENPPTQGFYLNHMCKVPLPYKVTFTSLGDQNVNVFGGHYSHWVYHIETTQIIQEDLPVLRSINLIPSAKSFWPWAMTYSQAPEIRAWTSSGATSPPHYPTTVLACGENSKSVTRKLGSPLGGHQDKRHN